MSTDYFRLACDITRAHARALRAEAPMTDLSLDPRNIIRRSRELVDEVLAENQTLKARVRDLEGALQSIHESSTDPRAIAIAAVALEGRK